MRLPAEPIRSLSRSRLALVLAIPFLAAGCSSESSRFGEGAFSNPFSSNSAPSNSAPETTGSISQRPAPAPQVESRPLPQTSSQQQPPYQPQPQYQQQPYQPAPQSRYQSSYQPSAVPPPTRPATFNNSARNASYQPASAPAQDYTGSVRNSPQAQQAPVPRQAPSANSTNWQWEGGTAITVGQGETIDSLANRYGVPAAAIAQSNGLAANAPIYPGQRIVIPKYNYAGAPATAPAPAPAAYTPPPAPATRATVNTTSHRTTPVPGAQGQAHIVKPGETLIGLSRRYNRPIAEIAAANNLQPYHKVQAGDRIIIPGAARVAAAPQAPAPQSPPQQQAQQPRYAAAQPAAPTARMVTPAAEKPPVEETNSADANAGAAGFRWPARGRIIAGFGPKPTGQQNDGINLALPEGTPVKAADDGVVAYAGNELKGYGNLVLIRHANGFVTAYAHASELMVKRGDTIKRGQVIAKSGQSGNVTSPQLHFEIRKGASPVDPMQHLPGA
jgi:murein DD-endopeptidase MepM/ murein hydrolase activator NlpD